MSEVEHPTAKVDELSLLHILKRVEGDMESWIGLRVTVESWIEMREKGA